MKSYLKLFAIFLSFSTLLVGICIEAWADTEETYSFIVNDDGVLEGYIGIISGDVVIPEKIDGKTVTAIGYYALKDCQDITSVSIPESVTSIHEGAFFGCTGLANVNIPSRIKDIESFVFENCSSLPSINIPDGVNTIGTEAFALCSSLTSIDIPASVTEIYSYAFAMCSNLESIHIPQSVTFYDGGTFYGCSSLQSIDLPDGMRTVVESMFYDCDSLTEINLPSKITEIFPSAFYDCDGLTSIRIPADVYYIGSQAFFSCDALASVQVSIHAESMRIDDAFCDCTNLKSFYFPPRIQVSYKAFAGCNDLTIYGHSGGAAEYFARELGLQFKNVVFMINENGELSVPVTYKGELNQDFVMPDNVFGEKVISIKDSTFKQRKELLSISIPTDVSYIGQMAFDGCENLTNVFIPEDSKLIEIGFRAFINCRSLSSIFIPASVNYIGQDAFRNCEQLTIFCEKGSVAETYAKNNGINFQNIIVAN